MQYELIERKVQNGKNIEFRYRKTGYTNQYTTPISSVIKSPQNYYTKSGNTITPITIKGTSPNEYVSSVDNTTGKDNINNLPTYI